MKTNQILSIGAVLVAALAVYFVFFGMSADIPIQHACTMEAKICPDGSSVGRTGPNCEFAECPVVATSTPPVPTPAATSATAHSNIGQKVTGLNVSLTPLEIISDSRCPTDVQCIWAGTVELNVQVQNGSQTNEVTLTLGKPAAIAGVEITLTEVAPDKTSGTGISTSSYRFTFLIEKK